MKILRLIIVSLVLIYSNAIAQTEQAIDPKVEILGKWLQSYYKQPDPESIAEHFAELRTLPYIQHRLPTIAGFTYGVLKTQTNTTSAVLAYSKAAPEFIPAIVLGLNILDHQDMRPYTALKKAFPEYAEKIDMIRDSIPKDVQDIEIKEGAWAIDFWWGLYFATGSENALLPFYQAIQYVQTQKYDELYLLNATAVWTLQLLARQDQHLMAQLESKKQRCTEMWCQSLDRLLAGNDLISLTQLEQATRMYMGQDNLPKTNNH